MESFFKDPGLTDLIVEITSKFGYDGLVDTVETYIDRPLSEEELENLSDNVYSIVSLNCIPTR